MRIFSIDDFVEGNIPGSEDFTIALNEFEEKCIFPFLGKEVVGSFAYGSVNRNDCNVASDIDYLVIISDEEHRKNIRKGIFKSLREKNIHIQSRAIHIDHAKLGLHKIDNSFRQHLEFSVSKYGHNGRNPLEILTESSIPFKESLKDSMAVYLSKLNASFVKSSFNETEYLKFLKTIMEKPWHAMRVMVQYACGSVVPNGEKFEDTKGRLIEIYRGLDYDSRLIDSIERIENVGREYIKTLEERQGIDKVKTSVYCDVLRKIERCYDDAYDFVDKNARMMRDFTTILKKL